MHCPSNCFCFIQPCSTDGARLHICKLCKHCINFHFWSCSYSCVTNQYRHALSATVLQRQCGVHCLIGTHGSWAVVQMRVGFLFLLFLRVCSHAMPWSRRLCALTHFPVVRIPLCRNSILSLPAVVSRMKQRTVQGMCVTLLNSMLMNFAILIMFVCLQEGFLLH